MYRIQYYIRFMAEESLEILFHEVPVKMTDNIHFYLSEGIWYLTLKPTNNLAYAFS